MWQRNYEIPAQWEEATEEEVRYSLSKGFESHAISSIVQEMKNSPGYIIPAGFAQVRWIIS